MNSISKFTITFLFLITSITAACSFSTEPTPSATLNSPTVTPVPEPTMIQETPTPYKAIIETGFDEPFTLIWEQTAVIPEAHLEIFYQVDIEFECPDDHDCEVPLIWNPELHITQSGELLGQYNWAQTINVEGYTLEVAELFNNYNYETHQFLIEITVTQK